MEKQVSAAKKITSKEVKSDNVSVDTVATQTKKSSKGAKITVAVMSVLLLGALAFGGFIYMKYRDISNDPSSAITEKNQAETDRVIGKLKAALLVTETDAPTVARVEEPEKLIKSNQEFYKDIQTGDYLIIFPKRAIIYRESIDQIINVAPIINTADLKTNTPTTPTTTDTTNSNN